MNKHTAVVASLALASITLAAFLIFAMPDVLALDGENSGLVPVEPVACTMDAKQCPDGTYVGRIGPRCEFAPCKDSFPYAEPEIGWRFSSAREHEWLPYTNVYVSVDGREYTVGEYVGTCSEAGAPPRLENELASSVCWWAGGGYEVGVFKEAGKLMVKVGELDEGSSEQAGFRGNFKTIMEVR